MFALICGGVAPLERLHEVDAERRCRVLRAVAAAAVCCGRGRQSAAAAAAIEQMHAGKRLYDARRDRVEEFRLDDGGVIEKREIGAADSRVDRTQKLGVHLIYACRVCGAISRVTRLCWRRWWRRWLRVDSAVMRGVVNGGGCDRAARCARRRSVALRADGRGGCGGGSCSGCRGCSSLILKTFEYQRQSTNFLLCALYRCERANKLAKKRRIFLEQK